MKATTTIAGKQGRRGGRARRLALRRSVPAALLAAAAIIPASSAWTPSSPTSLSATSALAASTKSATKKFKGTTVDTRWGPIQVTISVKNKKITGVSVGASPDTARSSFIQSNAIPILKQETLQAQSAKINEVSGATDISAAYIQSLQAAIKTARQAKALK